MQENRKYLTVYSASAGSGKTYTLAAEYIARLLSEPLSPHRHVLAVTFTNKATAEMKERILQRLYDLSTGTAEDFRETLLTRTYYAKELRQLGEQELRNRAGKALREIIHDYDHFYVQTIDSFFQQLLSNLARELGLSSNYRVDIDDKSVVEQAVDSFLQDLNAEYWAPVERQRQQRLVRWIREYIASRVVENKSWNLKEDLRKFAGKNVLSEIFQKNKESLSKILEDDAIMASFRKQLDDLRKKYENGGSEYEILQRKIVEIRESYAALEPSELHRKGQYFNGFIGKLETGLEKILAEAKDPLTDSVRNYIEYPEIFIKEGARNNPALRDKVALLFSNVKRLCAHLTQANRTLISCNIVLKNLNQLRLLGELSQKTDELNAEHNRFMLSQTKILFSELVEGSDAPFVFEKTGMQFRHVMIDEFQDTARTQWKNLKKLILENAATGDSCLLVGDVKQSIYRFNGGDWKILANIEKEAGIPVCKMRLEDNFRSEWHIVQFNNSFFRLAAFEVDRMADNNEVSNNIYDVREEGQRCRKAAQKGYVRVTVNRGKDNVALAEEGENAPANLYHQIERLHSSGLAYCQMAVLVRRRVEGRRVMEHFAKFHPEVPFVSDEAFFFSNSPAVCLIVDTLKYLHSKICRDDDLENKRLNIRHLDTIALVELLKTYYWMIRSEKIPFEQIAEQKEALLPEDFVSNYKFLYHMPLYELCEYLCKLFRLGSPDANDWTKGQAAYVLGFLDEVLAFLQDHPSDVGDFLDYWKDKLCVKSISGTEADGIQIVTIHKSKGLAYHTVLIPFCDWEIEKTKSGSDNYLWSKAKEAPFNLFEVFPVNQTKSVTNSVYSSDYKKEIEQLRVEALNLAYVAFTRPRKNLFVWAEARLPKDIHAQTIGDVTCRALQKGIDTMVESKAEESLSIYEAGEPFAFEESMQADPSKSDNPLLYVQVPEAMTMNVTNKNVQFRQSNESLALLRTDDASDDDRSEYVRLGNLYHAILSQVGTPADVSVAITRLQQQGVVNGDNVEKIRGFIEKRIFSEKVREWFDGSWQLHNEAEIFYTDAQGKKRKVRPDRVMTKDGEAVVVDYKFGRPNAEHKAQVSEYVRLLADMGYHPVSGFLWYVYDNHIERIK